MYWIGLVKFVTFEWLLILKIYFHSGHIHALAAAAIAKTTTRLEINVQNRVIKKSTKWKVVWHLQNNEFFLEINCGIRNKDLTLD